MDNTAPPTVVPVPVKLVECPRDAMQGWKHFIPTNKKIDYLNALLEVGFDTIDFGSFVSAKAIPQMADTKEVISRLSPKGNTTKLLAIIANVRGAEEAAPFEQITYLGFPFSVAPTFQLRNTNSTMEQALANVEIIRNICLKSNKELLVYISMGFGNPYGDEYSEEIVMAWLDRLAALEVKVISIADTVGLAAPGQVSSLLHKIIPQYPGIEVGVHLHSTSLNREAKIAAALQAGCTRFDGALKGIGGCPMANDELVGNIDSIFMIDYFEKHFLLPPLNREALEKAIRMAGEIFV